MPVLAAGLAACVDCRRYVTELIVRHGWVGLKNLRVNAIKLFMPVNAVGGITFQAQRDAAIGP